MQPTGDERNGNGKSRLDRLEGLMELLIDDHLKFTEEHRQLLTSQVLLSDAQSRTEKSIRELAEAQARTEKTMQELGAAQKATEERMGILIHMMDEFIRNRDR